MSNPVDVLQQKLAVVSPIRLDNNGSNSGDLWHESGQYIGNIDDPIYADFIVAAVNILPRLIAEIRRLQAIEAAAREYFDVQYRYRNGFAAPDPDYHLESNAAYDALMALLTP